METHNCAVCNYYNTLRPQTTTDFVTADDGLIVMCVVEKYFKFKGGDPTLIGRDEFELNYCPKCGRVLRKGE